MPLNKKYKEYWKISNYKISKVADRRRGWTEGFLLNSYYIYLYIYISLSKGLQEIFFNKPELLCTQIVSSISLKP